MVGYMIMPFEMNIANKPMFLKSLHMKLYCVLHQDPLDEDHIMPKYTVLLLFNVFVLCCSLLCWFC